MEKIDQYIEVITTSRNGLRTMSPKTATAIRAILKTHYAKVEMSLVDSMDDLELLAKKNPDLVFNGLKGVSGGTKGYMSVFGYLESLGVRVIGSEWGALELARDKVSAKKAVSAKGLATAKYVVANIDHDYDASSLSIDFPVFVKPSNRGGGNGIGEDSVSRNFEELNSVIRDLVKDKLDEILIESYLPGREFSVGILKRAGTDLYDVMPIEQIAPENAKGDRVLGGSIKDADTEKSVRVESDNMKEEIATFAEEVFVALGARDYGRIDIRLDDKGAPHFIEANLMPGLTDHGYFYRCFHLNGKGDYDAMILSIAHTALMRESKSDTV